MKIMAREGRGCWVICKPRARSTESGLEIGQGNPYTMRPNLKIKDERKKNLIQFTIMVIAKIYCREAITGFITMNRTPCDIKSFPFILFWHTNFFSSLL
jgi:hypothetical protein